MVESSPLQQALWSFGRGGGGSDQTKLAKTNQVDKIREFSMMIKYGPFQYIRKFSGQVSQLGLSNKYSLCLVVQSAKPGKVNHTCCNYELVSNDLRGYNQYVKKKCTIHDFAIGLLPKVRKCSSPMILAAEQLPIEQ